MGLLDIGELATYLEATPCPCDTVTFPKARAQVTRLERTFWEKITLAHLEVTLGDDASYKERCLS